MMGCWQRRIGPINLGLYGILSVFINGFNLIISHVIIPNLHYSPIYIIAPVYYLYLCIILYYISYPFYIYDLYLSFILLILISGLSIIFIIFARDSMLCFIIYSIYVIFLYIFDSAII